MPYYQKLGEMPRKHHIWFSRNGQGPTYKNEGIAYEHVITTEGFNEAYSIMYHLRPPTRVRNVKLLKCEELKKVTDSPLRHHHLKTATIRRKGDLYTGRVPILFNQDVVAYRARPEKAYDKFEISFLNRSGRCESRNGISTRKARSKWDHRTRSVICTDRPS